MGVTGVVKCQKLKLQGTANAHDFNINIKDDVFHINRGEKSLFTIKHDEATHSNSEDVIELSTFVNSVKFKNDVKLKNH